MSKELSDLLVALTGLVNKLTAIADNFEKGAHMAPQIDKFQIVEKCPRCGRPLIRKFNNVSREYFIGCSGYKDSGCNYTAEWDSARYHMLDQSKQNDIPDMQKPKVERYCGAVRFEKIPAAPAKVQAANPTSWIVSGSGAQAPAVPDYEQPF